MTWQVLRIGYYLLWLGLLVHCLRARRLFPDLGSPRWTRGFWLVTFCFFNPLLTILYLVFGLALGRWATGRRNPARIAVSATAVIGVLATLLVFETPAPAVPSPGTTDPNGPPASAGGIRAHVGALRSRNNLSTASSSATSGASRLALSTLRLSCTGDHPLLRHTAAALRTALASLPGVRRVLWEADAAPGEESRLADGFIRLSLDHIQDRRTPLGHRIEATLRCEAATWPRAGTSWHRSGQSPPLVDYHITCRLEHRSEFHGLESPAARYQRPAADIAGQFAEALAKQFRTWADKHGYLPPLPSLCYGRPEAAPTFDVLTALGARRLISGPGLLTHNHTVWTFADPRPDNEVYRDCRDRLRELGFRGGDWLDDPPEHIRQDLHLTRGEEQIAVQRDASEGRSPPPAAAASPRAWVVSYTRFFSTAEHEALVSQLLDDAADTEVLLLFARRIRGGPLRQRLVARLEADRTPTLRSCLALAELQHEIDDPNAARISLLRARALARLEKAHNAGADRIRSLARSLGDEALAAASLDSATLRACGFLDVTDPNSPRTVERPVDVPLALCLTRPDGTVTTAVVRLDPNAAHDATAAPPQTYTLTRIVKTDNSSSVGSITGRTLTGQVHLHIQDYGSINVTLQPTDPNRIRYTITLPQRATPAPMN